MLADLGADHNTQNYTDATPVLVAAQMGHAGVVRVLHELGADLNTPMLGGFTPVFIAAQDGHAEVVGVLAELGANVTTPNDYGATPVFIAAQNGHVEVVRLLAKLGACVQTPKADGATPAFVAAEVGHVKVVRVLAELGANLDTADEDGWAPVLIAAQNGHVKTVTALAELGANIDAADMAGDRPVCVAAGNGHVEVVKILAELGVNLMTPNKYGATPAHVAAADGHADVIRLMGRFRADIAAPVSTLEQCHPLTPLASSVTNGHFEATKALLLLGAPITIEDLKHYTGSAGNTRMLRAVLQAWAEDAVAQHRIFLATFLFGCTVHPRKITVETTTSKIAVPQSAHGLPATIVSKSAPLRFTCAVTGARGETTTVTTLTPTAVTTVTTNTRTNNAILPMLEGHEPVLQLVAGFAGVLTGEELRHTQTIGPAITAIKWVDEDAAECGWDADKQLPGDFLSRGPGNVRARAESLYAMAPVRGDGP